MAIQNRRGYYGDFDPEKMVAGEFAFVTSGDPNTSDGQAIYGCFTPGSVKRFATYEDMRAEILNAYAEDLPDMETAAAAANSAAQTATSAAQTAQTAAQTATDAADTANAAAMAASEYVLGDISEKTVTFEKDADRIELESADSVATLFGKLKKWLEDLGAAAFQNVVNDLTTEDEGYVLDARQGQVLQQQINEIVNFGDTGEEIPANTDLNSLTEFGRYYSPNSTRTATLTNKPVGLPSAAFVLEVDTSGAWNRQTIFSGHNTYPVKYVRNFAGTTFSLWNRVIETAVTNSGTIELSGFMCAGYLTGAQKAIYFCIPLPGLKGGASGGTLSGSYVIRDADGGYIGNSAGQTLQSLGTVTVNIMPNCVYAKVDLTTALTYTNNTPIVVNCQANSYLTLS